jgi:tight adherence protein B
MLPALATFVLCLTIILGGYWAFAVRQEQVAARTLRRRLEPGLADQPQRTDLTKKDTSLSAVKVLDTLLSRLGSVVQPLQQSIALAALPITVGMVLIACALMGTVTFLTVALSTGLTWLAILLGLSVALLPYAYVHRAARTRLHRLEEQFPQAVDLITVSLRAGHAFTTGMLMVAEELSTPLGSEFRLMYDQQNYGKPLPDALKEFAQRVPLLDARIFVTAVLTQRETGGNLAEVLDKLTTLIRERVTIRRQVKAASANGRITGWVLVFLPPAVAGLLFLTAREHLLILVQDPLGLQLLAGAIVLQAIGTVAIRRIVNVEL